MMQLRIGNTFELEIVKTYEKLISKLRKENTNLRTTLSKYECECDLRKLDDEASKLFRDWIYSLSDVEFSTVFEKFNLLDSYKNTLTKFREANVQLRTHIAELEADAEYFHDDRDMLRGMIEECIFFLNKQDLIKFVESGGYRDMKHDFDSRYPYLEFNKGNTYESIDEGKQIVFDIYGNITKPSISTDK